MERDNRNLTENDTRRVLAESADRLITRIGLIADAPALWECERARFEASSPDREAEYRATLQAFLALPGLRRLAGLDGPALVSEFGIAFEDFNERCRDGLLDRGWYFRQDQPPEVQALMDELALFSVFVLTLPDRKQWEALLAPFDAITHRVWLAADRVWRPEQVRAGWLKAELCDRLSIGGTSFDTLRDAAGIPAGEVGDTQRLFSIDDLRAMADVARKALPRLGTRAERELRLMIARASS
jgi:hypothetical protein